MVISHIQNALIEEVHNELLYFIQLKWKNNLGVVNIYTKKYKLFQTILDLSNNYTNYYKKEYKVEQIIIKEIKNSNPHIKINFNK